MDRAVLENLLSQINGCTFASIDAETEVSPGVKKVVSGRRVILFTNKLSNGYENMVKRRLIEAGKNPENFVLHDLPWGTRVPETPLIEHKDKVYLQCIELSEGTARYYIAVTGVEVDPAQLNLKERHSNQGLPPGEEVNVRAYDLNSITRIALMGENLVSERETQTVLPAALPE